MSVFTPSGSAGLPGGSVTIEGAENPLIANVSIPTANTEVSYVLPTGTKMFSIKLRPPGQARMQLSYISGDSGLTYITIPANANYCHDGLSLPAGVTLYFQASQGSQIAEIVSWT